MPTKVTKEAGKLVKRIALEEVKRATGDGRMSGMGPGRGAKLRASVRTRRKGKAVTVELRGVPIGAWAILQSGAKSHVIAPRTDFMGGSLRHPLEVPVRHTGVRNPKRTWSKVSARAHAEVPGLAAKLVREEFS